MVLMFTLGILALLAILGATIFLATQDDLQVSAETTIGRDAFSKADFTTVFAAYLGRVAITAGSAGDVADTLAPGGIAGRPGFVVNLHDLTKAGLLQLGETNTEDLIKERYILATDGNTGKRPHVEVFYYYGGDPDKKQLVGTAAIGYGQGDPTEAGTCLADNCNAGIDSPSKPYYLVISSDGRVPQRGQDSSPPVKDPSNYYDGDNDAKHTIVTAIYRLLL